jgi:glycolate oxidase FAD binding subunit
MRALIQSLADSVRAAAATGVPLRIRGSGSKDFYGNTPRGELLDTRPLQGIVAYEPTELVLTARAGTPLPVIESALAAERQMLAFEPPHFGPGATLGGCIACALAGPRRAAYGYSFGAVRDFVLGTTLLDGRAQVLRFGGTVMKNVAGYDVSRLLAGSMGALGVILEASIKVLPMPVMTRTLALELSEAATLGVLANWGRLPLPISASSWQQGVLRLRLAGAAAAVSSAVGKLGGEVLHEDIAASYWHGVREHSLEFFAGDTPLWRFSLPFNAESLQLSGTQLIEWSGAQRWLRSAIPAQEATARAAALGGHATLFRGGDRSNGVFQKLSPPVMKIHERLIREYDPLGVFDAGRLIHGFRHENQAR